MKIFGLIVSFALLLNIIPPSRAQLSYQFPKRKQQQQTQSAATRGCERKLPQLQILAPADHVAASAAERPTFLFSISEQPLHPLKISLTQPHAPQALWKDERRVERGIFSVSLPESLQLSPGQDYILTAALPCDPEKPESSSYVRVVFQRAAMPSERGAKWEQSPELFTQWGLWYDALYWSYQNSPSQFEALLKLAGIQLP